jgi:hypothetical protein
LRNVKIFNLFFIKFLIIGLFANSLLPQACFCGEACRHGPQGTAQAGQCFPFHNRCSGTQCTSCNVEDVQRIKLSNSAPSTAKLDIFDSPTILFNFSDYQSNVNFIRIFFSHPNEYVKVQFPPAYLGNLSLLL